MINNKDVDIETLVNNILDTDTDNSKQTETKQYNYFEQIVKDCITELKHRKETYCFKRSQVEQIQSVINCTVVYDGIYTLTVG